MKSKLRNACSETGIPEDSMIRTRDLSVVFNPEGTRLTALQEINLSVAYGESCAVIGPSGCGKSTLLYILAGLYSPTEGAAYIDGKPAVPKRKNTSLILQDYGLLPWQTAWQNTVLGLKLRGVTVSEQKMIAEQILQDLGLWTYRSHYPAQLSGGQRQRVAIARALTLKPDLLLMDEPFSSLDALTRESLQETLLAIWRKDKVTSVLVTHNIEEAVYLGQKIVIFSPRPGRILHCLDNPQIGDPNYRSKPAFYSLCSLVRKLLEEGMTVD
jgi:NitT/TauT family transport system ATP-binding protein